ncbi:sugar transferase [Haloarchaeobius amylolyticus]|uniref:Sugar transferase n=1 Tax=Haloarchaeobius amylolyticus TaxID=1198296 RepID=A0ABD6BDD3_9EURY
MKRGNRYRILSATGVAGLTALAVLIANHRFPQRLFTTYVPFFNRLPITVLSGDELGRILLLSVGISSIALAPLYRPRPRRPIDTIVLVQRRVVVASLALATIGYFNWSHRLPRATLVLLTGTLAVLLPLWFLTVSRRPTDEPDRALIVGNDPAQIKQLSAETTLPYVGYLCPSTIVPRRDSHRQRLPVADGGEQIHELERFGGLTRLEDVLLANDIDTVVLAFEEANRGDLFGVLDTCYEHGVAAKVHRDYADDVLVSGAPTGTLVDVEVEPLDLQDHLLKRGFDVAFALAGLLAFAPLFAVIAVAIKLDSDGPVLYSQRRTAGLGGTLTVYKFRTMHPEGESPEPIDDDENDRITRVGQILRSTHLDELPQLWLIFVGKMSVVGPRPVWTDEETLLEAETDAWRKRWFVKPGLTGLAQVRDLGSTDPEAKLRSDLEYIRRQSFRLDISIVVRQIAMVFEDIVDFIQ